MTSEENAYRRYLLYGKASSKKSEDRVIDFSLLTDAQRTKILGAVLRTRKYQLKYAGSAYREAQLAAIRKKHNRYSRET